MANGKRFDRRKLTAASWYVPLGTVLRVVNLENGRSVTVTVTDRGPNLRLHRIVDLSEAAARELGYVEKGLTPVFVSPILAYEPQHAVLHPRFARVTGSRPRGHLYAPSLFRHCFQRALILLGAPIS